jgi:hypothetical protein
VVEVSAVEAASVPCVVEVVQVRPAIGVPFEEQTPFGAASRLVGNLTVQTVRSPVPVARLTVPVKAFPEAVTACADPSGHTQISRGPSATSGTAAIIDAAMMSADANLSFGRRSSSYAVRPIHLARAGSLDEDTSKSSTILLA